LMKDYEGLAEKSAEMQATAFAAAKTAIGNQDVINAKWAAWKKEMDDAEAKQKEYEASDKVLAELVKTQMKSLKQIENNRNEMAIQFVRLARKPVKDVTKCDIKILKNYKTVMEMVSKTTVYNKGQGFLWADKGQGTKTVWDRRAKTSPLNDTVEKHCWTEKDKNDLMAIEKKMQQINIMVNQTLPGYLSVMKKLHENMRDRSSYAGKIAAIISKRGQYEASWTDRDNAYMGLIHAEASLRLIKTIFLDVEAFWRDQKEFMKEYLAKPPGSTQYGPDATDVTVGDKVGEIMGLKDKEQWRVDMIETGMYWLVFGRLNSLGYQTLGEAKDRINAVFSAKVPTPEERKQILGTAEDVMTEIRKYHAAIKEAETADKLYSDKVLRKLLEKFGDKEDQENFDPLVTTTAVVVAGGDKP